MDFFLTTTICLVGLKYSYGNPYDHIVDDMCRYRFHLHPLPWYQAQEVCRGIDRTLTRLDNIEKLELIANMATSNVSSRVPDANLSEIWIGLRAESSSHTVYHFWENCEEFVQSDDANWVHSNETSRDGCIAISPDVTKYKAVDCDEARPFICETQAAVPCYDEVHWYDQPDVIFVNYFVRITDQSNCEYDCLRNANYECFVFQHDFSYCNIGKARMTTGDNYDFINARRPAYTLAFIDLNSYSALTTTIPPPLASCIDSVMPSSTIEVSSVMASSSSLVEETATDNTRDEITIGLPTNEVTIEQQFHVTTDDQPLEEITTYSRVSYMSGDAIESSEPKYTTSALGDKISSTATQPLTAFSLGLKETPVESSTSCPRGGMTSEMISKKIRQIAEDIEGGMTSEMISKKIRQIAEDMEGDDGKKDNACKRVFSENVAANGCAGDKTFPRGAELMSSINEIRREIIMSKMRRN